jgi:hypothetical protein
VRTCQRWRTTVAPARSLLGIKNRIQRKRHTRGTK